MNSTERAYAQRLERLKLEGKIAKYEYEGDRLPLGDDCTYTPDFRVDRPMAGSSITRSRQCGQKGKSDGAKKQR